MITNPVLETKYRTQRQLDKDAGHDVRKYMEKLHQIACDVEKQYDVKFNYGSPQGAEVDAQEGGQPKSA